jgi:hypothetical protein
MTKSAQLFSMIFITCNLQIQAETSARMGAMPRIPEPMVFDLVRPLGAPKGEVEINTLAIVPLRRTKVEAPRTTDPHGMLPQSVDHMAVEWAPEIEFTPWDGLGLEFELPFEGRHLEAYKFAVQWTMGALMEDRFIHGWQMIAQREIDPQLTAWTLLYIAGYRFDERWSILGMLGGSKDVSAETELERQMMLVNANLFADLSKDLVAGLEINYSWSFRHSNTLLIMPQIHVDLSEQWAFQLGLGARSFAGVNVPEAGARIIAEF